MKSQLIKFFSLILFLSGCSRVPALTPLSVSTVPPAPTFIAASLPEGLAVAYIVEDALWLWKQNSTKLLIQQEHIFDPQLSDDGQWLIFRQEHISLEEKIHTEDVWAIRTDGSELHRLLGSDDLTARMGEEVSHFINDISWLPGRHELLFNTDQKIEGPPEIWPVFDLFLLDLSGHITRLADPGAGGRFTPSPDGLYVALATDERVGILNLENGERRTLLDFQPLELGCECIAIPRVAWDPESQFVLISIPPHKLHSPEEYAGEPEKVWRLFVNGKAELVAQWMPLARVSGIEADPKLQYFLYLHDSCADAMGMVQVHELTSGKESALFCAWELPQAIPDGEHFIYEWDGLWRLGDVSDATGNDPPLDVLNVPTDPTVHHSPRLIWVDDEYFLLVLRGEEACTLSIATLQGVVTEIIRTPPDLCPEPDLSLSH